MSRYLYNMNRAYRFPVTIKCYVNSSGVTEAEAYDKVLDTRFKVLNDMCFVDIDNVEIDSDGEEDIYAYPENADI